MEDPKDHVLPRPDAGELSGMQQSGDTDNQATEPLPKLSNQQLIDYIYDIALDPANLPDFIDRIEDVSVNTADDKLPGTGKSPGTSKSRRDGSSQCSPSGDRHSGKIPPGSHSRSHSGSPAELTRIETLSALLESHLTRAETFLDRVSSEQSDNEIENVLSSYDSTPALLVNAALEIVASNAMAVKTYAIGDATSLEEMPFEAADIDTLFTTLRQMLRDQSGKGELLALQLSNQNSTESTPPPALLHANWVNIQTQGNINVAGRSGFVLLVSTDVSWPTALDQTLNEVFALTSAERGILRSLVEGRTLNTIAEDRHRSIGTIRTQVKSILSKTRTHSQSELIRVTLSLMEIIKRAPRPLSTATGFQANLLDSGNPEVPTPAEFHTLTLADGRKLDYLVQGDRQGHPVLFSHMGYGLALWPPKAIELAMTYKLKVITPVRSGFGKSDKVDKSADILKVTREDTLSVLECLGIDHISYIAQGNDLIFAMDFAHHYRDRVEQIIGLGVRLPLASDVQYAGMGKWHRFILSTARYAPHLLYFAAKAAFILGRKIGPEQMFRNVHRDSPADIAIQDHPEIKNTLIESSQLSLSEDHTAAFAYAKELFATETDWSELVRQTQNVPAWYVSGNEDPLGDPATIAAYREAYPWIEIEVVENAGQLLFFQQFEQLIPRISESILQDQQPVQLIGDSVSAELHYRAYPK